MALIKKNIFVYCFDIIKYIIIELYKSITFLNNAIIES